MTSQAIYHKISQQLLKMRSLDLMSEKNFEYLNIKNPKEARFYLLPKVHKKDIPGRPICSSINQPTSHISKVIDEHIKKYVPKTKIICQVHTTLNKQIKTTWTNTRRSITSHFRRKLSISNLIYLMWTFIALNLHH